jgi:hypothetical protein
MENPQSFEDFHPISLCNFIYKVITNIIARRIKPILSASIFKEQFSFLEGRKIHEAIGMAQEGLHSLKIRKLKGDVFNIDLSKSYDRVNCLFICILLTHLGFEVPFTSWVMSCISSISFDDLNNGSASPFFYPKRGIIQDIPLSPLFFLLMEEGLSHSLSDAKD